jgi:hypothetical protein
MEIKSGVSFYACKEKSSKTGLQYKFFKLGEYLGTLGEISLKLGKTRKKFAEIEGNQGKFLKFRGSWNKFGEILALTRKKTRKNGDL